MGLLADANFYVLPLALLWTQMVQQASSVLRSQDLDNGTVSSTATLAGCRQSCGNLTFQYPFGIGTSGCYRNPDFNLICNDTSQPPKLFLNDGISQVFRDIITNDTQSFYQDTKIFINWSQTIPIRSGVNVYNMSWTAPGRAFAISYAILNITGCNFDVYLVDRNSDTNVTVCTLACSGTDILETVARQSCNGSGCCHAILSKAFRSFHLKFVRHSNGSLETRSNRSSLWDEITVAIDTAALRWSIMDQPICTSAVKSASYACVSNNSRCMEDSTIGSFGYYCSCNPGYAGNPYVRQGCLHQKGYDPNQRRANCTNQCGNVTVEFPFGFEEGCFGSELFRLNCTNDTLQLDSYTLVTEIDVGNGLIKIKVPDDQVGYVYSMSRESLYVVYGESDYLQWAVANLTCPKAKQNIAKYACVSANSTCINVETKDQGYIGYRCQCPDGFEGNPYVPSGCKDTRPCHKITVLGSIGCTKLNILFGIIIGAISGGFGILLFSFSVIFLLRRRKRYAEKQARRKYFRQNHGLLLEQLISSDQNASDKTKIFSLEELEKATNDFDATRILGRGGHGMVYKGILSDQRVVAIKKSKVIEDGEVNQFINEVAILSQINHRNIVKLFGCCLETEVPLLVYDFIPNGSLFQNLYAESNNGFSLSWDDCVRIAIETAGALHYLHSAASISVFHRDVKSSNILLDANYTAKVSDFGASRLVPIDQTHVVTNVQGTFGYLDPEYYHTGQLNEKSDVYSFGVVLLELLLRKQPIFATESGSKQNLSNYFIWETKRRPISEIISAQVLDEATEEEIKSVASLAEMCLRLRREERPTMKQVEMALQSLRLKRLNKHDLALGEDEEMQPLMSARAKANCHSLAIDSGDKANLTYQQSQNCESLEQEYVSSLGLPR